MKQIKHFMLPENTNQLYNNEAISSISLTKEVAEKINEIVDMVNALSSDDLEWKHEQEGRIRKGVLFMKDNLVNSLQDLMDLLLKNGYVDERVAKYLGDLETRLNNIIANSSEDDELIDLRVGADGVNYVNAGEGVRKQLHNKNYGFVLTNNEPSLEFIANESVKIAFTGVTHIFYNNKRYDIPEKEVVKDISNFTNIFVFLLVYDIKNKSIDIIRSTDSVPENCIIFGRICKDELHLNDVSYGVEDYTPDSTRPLFATVYSNGNPYIYEEDNQHKIYFPDAHIYYKKKMYNLTSREVEFDYDVVGILFYICYDFRNDVITFIPHAHKVPSNNVVIGMFSKWYGVSLFTFDSQFKRQQTQTSIIMGASNQFVEFDNVNKIVSFPDDTLLLVQGLPHFYKLSIADGNNTISYSHMVSSALSIFYNIYTNQLEVLQYNTHKQPHQLLICSFRTTNGSVSINVPYKWNGVPYNYIVENDFNIITNENIKSIAHRGYSLEAPENTLSAYKLAKKKGFKYVECDVSFTSDNIPVLLHDNTIDRTSNGTGNISELTLEQVKVYDFGSWKSSAYTGEKIPTFEEFIKLCKMLGLHPYIELKTQPTTEQLDTLINIVKNCNMLNNASWISFNASALLDVTNKLKNTRIGFITSVIDENTLNTVNALKTETNEVFVDTSSYSDLSLLIENNIDAEVWTINEEVDMLLLPSYITGVTSDNLRVDEVFYNSVI